MQNNIENVCINNMVQTNLFDLKPKIAKQYVNCIDNLVRNI